MGIVRFSLKYGIEDEVTCIIQNNEKEMPPGKNTKFFLHNTIGQNV